jgi:hypothetical protein
MDTRKQRKCSSSFSLVFFSTLDRNPRFRRSGQFSRVQGSRPLCSGEPAATGGQPRRSSDTGKLDGGEGASQRRRGSTDR